MTNVREVAARKVALQLDPPWCGPVWVAGQVPPSPRVAIVGSRAVRRDVLRCVDPIVEAVAAAGLSVVSGGALGVDAAVHRSALLRGVPQIAVLPGPPDQLYPPDHATLFADIERAGALVFLHRAGSAYAKGMFASRNRVVVGLVERVIVIAAGLRSGTSLTIGLARRQGRPIAALAGTTGTGACIAQGATRLGDAHTSADELADAVRRFVTGAPGLSCVWPERLHPTRDVVARTQGRGATVDDFADPLAGVVGLVEAEALGLVLERAPGVYVLSSPQPLP